VARKKAAWHILYQLAIGEDWVEPNPAVVYLDATSD
jgi:hypothetical protein